MDLECSFKKVCLQVAGLQHFFWSSLGWQGLQLLMATSNRPMLCCVLEVGNISRTSFKVKRAGDGNSSQRHLAFVVSLSEKWISSNGHHHPTKDDNSGPLDLQTIKGVVNETTKPTTNRAQLYRTALLHRLQAVQWHPSFARQLGIPRTAGLE